MRTGSRSASAWMVMAWGLLQAASPCTRAAEAGTEHWTASSTTAQSVTGDVRFAPSRIVFHGGAALDLEPAGEQRSFKALGDVVHARLYKVRQPADLVLRNGNHLCGGKPARTATWIAVWSPEPLDEGESPRALAVSSANEAPASATGPASCGVYDYTLAR